MLPSQKNIYTGIALATLATLIWSGNFIVARGVIKDIPPVTLAFFRWLTASIVLLPFAWKSFLPELQIVKKHYLYFIMAAITGVSMFNTFVYIAGHTSTAINMVLIGTTSSPVMSIILARIFLKETVPSLRLIGMFISITGILLLLSDGSLQKLLSLSFSKGDLWVLTAALAFAVYNTLVKKKPVAMNPTNFLFTIFIICTLFLVPFYLYELKNTGGIEINTSNLAVILYLGVGASVISFLFWNAAIARLGSGRTALFGNLMPVFSSIEAVLILREKITLIHLVSFVLVITGLVIANVQKNK